MSPVKLGSVGAWLPTLEAVDPLRHHEAEHPLRLRENEALAVGRQAHRLGYPAGIEPGQGPSGRSGVPARREVLDEDAVEPLLVLSGEEEALAVRGPSRAARRDRG